MNEQIKLDFDTDDLEPLSDDEVPEDMTQYSPETNQDVNQKTTDNIHQTVDKVCSIYKYLTDGLHHNSQKLNEFMDSLDQQKTPLNDQSPPEMLSMHKFIEDISNN